MFKSSLFDLYIHDYWLAGQVDALPPLNDARVNHGCTRFRQNPSDNEYSLIVAGGWLSGEYNPKVFYQRFTLIPPAII